MVTSHTSAVTRDRRIRLVLAAVSLALFVAVGLAAWRVHGETGSSRLDRVASRVVDAPQFGRLLPATDVDRFWSGRVPHLIVSVGLPLAAVAVIAGFGLAAWSRGDRRALALCLLGPLVAVALTDLVAKPLVGRTFEGELAYPSGHATGAAAVAVVALLLSLRWAGAGPGRRALLWLSPVVLGLPLVMGLGLIRFGWHYPSDVIGGVAMGAATVTGLAVALSSGGAPLMLPASSPGRGGRSTAPRGG